MVALIDDDEIGISESIEPARQGRDAAHLHGGVRGFSLAGGDHAMHHAERVQGGADLFGDLLAMAEDGDAVAAFRRAGDDSGEQNGFAGAGRRLIQHAARAVRVALPQSRDIGFLIRPQHWRVVELGLWRSPNKQDAARRERRGS